MGEAPIAAVSMRLLLLHRMNEIRNQTFHMRLTFSFSFSSLLFSSLTNSTLLFCVEGCDAEHIYIGGVRKISQLNLSTQIIPFISFHCHFKKKTCFSFLPLLYFHFFLNISVLVPFIYKNKNHT